ncbi:MAG: DUF3817 domain-containing protein [Proteobacteria bacterium]|nr:DUF3817 domain-containing protein [Pseudomonadota bacterium]
MISLFRLIGRCEGLSFVLLLGVAMPLKYIWGQPEYVRILGSAHGALFIAYIGMAFYLGNHLRWNKLTRILSFISAVLPLGTFLFEWKFLGREEKTKP